MKRVRTAPLVLSVAATAALAVVGMTALVRLFLGHMAFSAEVSAGVLVVAAAALSPLARRARPVPRATVLELDLSSAPVEVPSRNPLAALGGRRPMSLSATVAALERASRDDRVKGLVLQPRFSGAPQAVVEELRDALGAFARSGRFTVAFCDTFGDGGPANASYYLAAACDEVVMSPAGMVGFVPLWREPNFYRSLLDRLGVELEVFARQEFKSALAQLSETQLTPADRLQRQELLESLWSQEVEQVARSRHLPPGQLRQLAEDAPLTAAEALAGGLVDRLSYADELLTGAKTKAGPSAKLLYLSEYRKRAGREKRRPKTVPIGVIEAVGEIHRSAAPGGVRGGPVMAADKLVPLIGAAAKDKKLKAFVLRVDSPGGSAVASESIWRALAKLRETGRPLVVSMGAVAASGGYYISTAADRIVAGPGTITGSIGVISAHPVLAAAKAKLGVRPDEVRTGAGPSMFSVNRPYSAHQRERVDLAIDEIYGVFTQRVADGRGMAVERVREVGRGRVWSGADAVGIGLVDELGGLQRAMALAVEMTGAPAGARPRPKRFPRKASVLRPVRHRPESSDDAAGWAANAGATPGFYGGPGLAAMASQALIGVGRAPLMFHMGCDPASFWLP